MLRAKCQFLLCGAKRAYANNDLIDCVTTLRCHTVASGGPSTSIIIRIYEQVWYCSPPTCFPWHSLVICESMFDRFLAPRWSSFQKDQLTSSPVANNMSEKKRHASLFCRLDNQRIGNHVVFLSFSALFLLLFLMRNRTRDSWKNKF